LEALCQGNIKELYADYNTKVKKGQVIAVIDPQMFQARVDQARASQENARAAVLNAQAMLQKVDADISGAQANVANLRANVVRAKSAVVDAKAKLERRLDLGKQGILSREELDTAQAVYDQAVAQQQAAEAQVDAAERQVQATRAQRAVAEAQLQSAQAQVKQSAASLAQAEFDLRHTRIVAPVDGIVISRSMDVGQTVAASFQAPTIFEIAQDLTNMQVETSVDEAISDV
jgi:HlyD family secretion protein